MENVSAADTGWVLVSTALVMLMTPGLAFFYSGLVDRKSVLNTLLMSFAALGVVTLSWTVVGYSLAFADGSLWIGGLDYIFLGRVGVEALDGGSIPHLLFFAFQLMFAVITPALISGAVVGRMKFSAFMVFTAAWNLVVYAPLCHWVWGGGFLAQDGALDFAGGTVVHVSAGVSALVAAWMLGPRSRRGVASSSPHNIPFVLLGASLLWFGWFGFNAGSSLAADAIAVNALVTTHLAAATAMVTWLLLERVRGGRPSVVGAALGSVVGLVAITPAAGFVTAGGALAIGALGSVAAFVTLKFLEHAGLDDALDVFACHGVGGIAGSVLTGVFATTTVNPSGADGLLYGAPEQMIPQVTSVIAAALLAACGTFVILKVLELTMGIRVAPTNERALDQSEHDESAYDHGTEPLLGEVLLKAGHISSQQLREGLIEQQTRSPGIRLGEQFLQKGLITTEELNEALATLKAA